MGKFFSSILDPFLGNPQAKAKANDKLMRQMMAQDRARNSETPSPDEAPAQAPTLVDSMTQRDVEMRRRRGADPTNLTGGRLASSDVYNKLKATVLGE